MFLGEEGDGILFLMYRVELKGESTQENANQKLKVPNVPCGVESHLPVFGFKHSLAVRS